MLVEFSVANFKSIKDWQTLSLVASGHQEEADVQPFSAPGSTKSELRFLPSAALYGPNAAGKSNFLLALQTMQDFVVNAAAQRSANSSLPAQPFKLDSSTRNAPTEFEVIFFIDGTRYEYAFSSTEERIVKEELSAYPQNRAQRWFARQWDAQKQDYDWRLGPSLEGAKNLWKKSTRDDSLFLSTAVQLNSRQLQPVYAWFDRTILVIGTEGRELSPGFSAALCETDRKEAIMKFLKMADLGIDDIQVTKAPFKPLSLEATKETMKGNADKTMNHAIETVKRLLKALKSDFFDIRTLHQDNRGELVAFDLEDESNGTQKLFSFAGLWTDILDQGRILFIDELHGSLHPKLVEFLTRQFNDRKTNPNNAQLIFSTHETAILSQQLMRRDQVWFCEKDRDQTTQIYPLTDFRPRKGRENLAAGYLSGRYGAVPYVPTMAG